MARLTRIISVSALACLQTSGTIASDDNALFDYAKALERCCGILDEPSILENCNAEYSAIRIIEGEGGYPVGLIRIERQRDKLGLVSKVYETYASPKVTEAPISESDWLGLVDRLQDSGFWTFSHRSAVWNPDGPTLWVEACVAGEFRSISVGADQGAPIADLVDFLVRLRR